MQSKTYNYVFLLTKSKPYVCIIIQFIKIYYFFEGEYKFNRGTKFVYAKC